MGHLQPPKLLKTIVKRRDLIRCLDEGLRDKREIETQLGVSRQTVSRALRELYDANIIDDSRNGECSLSRYGEYVYRNYRQVATTYEQANSAEPLLRHLPQDVTLERDILTDATVVVSEPPAPRRPVREATNLLRDSKRVRGMSPVVLPEYVDTVADGVTNRGLSTELLLSSSSIDYLHTEYSDELQRVIRSGNCTVRRTERELPFGLLITDSRNLWLGVYDEFGNPIGAILNDNKRAVDWGVETLETYMSRCNEVGIELQSS